MKNKLSRNCLLPLIAVSAIAGGCKQKDPPPPGISAEQQAADAAGFKEFTDRLKDYVKLHNSQEAIIPAVKPTDLPEMINAHQQALARKIREARPNAKQGDIFTPAAQKSFEDVVQSTMKGPRGENAVATMKQGAPLTETSVIVNQGYPDGIPYTTVPPTLLQVFPKLPDEVVYRVVVHDLVLLDLKANLVVDLIPGIIPQS
jgi:hypothetical protein